MIREKAKELLNLLKQGKGCATLFGNSYYDEDVIKIIQVVTNECKSTIIDSSGKKKRYESDLEINYVKEIIKQLLSDNDAIKNTIIARLTTQKEIPGIFTKVKIEKYITDEGLPYLNIEKPFPDNLTYILTGGKNKEELINRVLKPYMSRITKGDKLSKRFFLSRIFNPFSRKEITNEELLKRYEEYLKNNTELDNEKIKNVSNYFVYNILGNNSIIEILKEDEMQGNSLIVLDEKRRTGYDGMLQNMSNNLLDIMTTVKNPNYGLEEIKTIYANLTGELQALSTEFDQDPKNIEDTIKNINKIINRNKQEYYSENGYRNVNVGFSGKNVGLLEREHVQEAMSLYSESISKLIANADEIEEEEYIKEVAKLHYRFIRIHPFPDGNGRTGRAIANILLLRKNMCAVFSKSNKKDYIRNMNLVFNEDQKLEYKKALYTDQSICDSLENDNIYKLEEFIGIQCLEKKDIYKDRQITEELPIIDKSNLEKD